MSNIVKFKPKRAPGINGAVDRIIELLREDKVKVMAVVCVTEGDEFMVRHVPEGATLHDIARVLLMLDKARETFLEDVQVSDREEV